MANISGTAGADTLRGGDPADTITGLAGNDILLGKAGDDTIDGGDGDDVAIGDQGADTVNGGAGDDAISGAIYNETTMTAADDGAVDKLNGGDGNDVILMGGGDIGVGGAGIDDFEFMDTTAAVAGASFDGGADFDYVNLGAYRFRTVVYLDQGLSTTDFHMTNIESLTLGAGGSQVFGGANADAVNGGAGVDVMDGAAGDDRLYGGGGDDLLNGGAGVDTAYYSSVRRAYTVGANLSSVTGATDGTDALSGFEKLHFVDGYFSTEAGAGDTAASVYRLYQTMLNRTPDSNGLANWVQAIDLKGSTLKAVANGFIGSPEFNGTYGALNNDQFVELMYANVLHRASDVQGKATWVGLLNSGGTRADVAIGFSQSNENISNLSPAIHNGIWVGDLNAGVAARFYDTVFGRLPDSDGLAFWTQTLAQGVSLTDVAAAFVAAPEFQTTYGSLNNSQFVELMYTNVLHRASDSGRQTWLDLLNAGGSRAQVVVGFSESAEHIRLTAPHIDDGVWIA